MQKLKNNNNSKQQTPHIDSTTVPNKVKHLENTKLVPYNIRAH